jgi:hypothetical protein
MTFSQRMGYEPDKKALQLNDIDNELRTDIYNSIREFEGIYSISFYSTYFVIWKDFYRCNLDIFAENWFLNESRIKKELLDKYDKLKWHHVYDYLEMYLDAISKKSVFSKRINKLLEQHNSAYRIVNNKVCPISDEQELSEVSEACISGQKAIDFHMNKAVEIFSNKVTKDYPNTIKEAICAVEAAVNIVNGTEGKTLGDALKQLDKKKKLPETLKSAFEKLYGYTNEKDSGIRHALINDAKYPPDFADAKFMLVACSAFINYLMQRNT